MLVCTQNSSGRRHNQLPDKTLALERRQIIEEMTATHKAVDKCELICRQAHDACVILDSVANDGLPHVNLFFDKSNNLARKSDEKRDTFHVAVKTKIKR